MRQRIVLATCRRWPDLSESDRCLAESLQHRGVDVDAAPWNESFGPFADATAVVVRATWDYHETLPAYREWLGRLDAARTFNPPGLIRANLEKSYLATLASAGVAVPRFAIVEATASAIAGALEQLELADAIIKPLVGANGVGVQRVVRGRELDALARMRVAAVVQRVIVQEFLSEVANGEVSGVFLAGAFSHAFRRVPLAGDFRVNSQYGGRMEVATLDLNTVHAMARIVGGLPEEPLYARVDGVVRNGRFTVMELELNEPSLALHLAPDSSDRLADALLRRLR